MNHRSNAIRLAACNTLVSSSPWSESKTGFTTSTRSAAVASIILLHRATLIGAVCIQTAVMARLAILTFAAVLRETTSMVLSRRQTLQRGSLAAVVPLLAPTPALASTKTDAEKVLEALQPLSGFVDDGKWDAVRTVLAQSPVVELWKTGNSKNWIRAAALSAGDPELIELSEDLSSALQLTDQCEAASGKKRRRDAIAATRCLRRFDSVAATTRGSRQVRLRQQLHLLPTREWEGALQCRRRWRHAPRHRRATPPFPRRSRLKSPRTRSPSRKTSSRRSLRASSRVIM